MQVNLADFVKQRPDSQDVEKILRACVHCGLCSSACPTYQLLGDERDGPRGRIYLIKQVMEGGPATRLTQQHLDRCLSCGACETACPSGVSYRRLLDVGRGIIAARVSHAFAESLLRRVMLMVFPYRKRFAALLGMARISRPLLPRALQNKIPQRQTVHTWPKPRHARKMLILSGCVQPTLAPGIDAKAARVLDKLGISLVPVSAGGCCGALSQHLDAHAAALQFARANIDACWHYLEQGLEQGAEAIVSTASGCGVMLKDYGTLLQYDPAYAAKAARFSVAVKDIAEVLRGEDLASLKPARPLRIAFQAPCTLQHGQRLSGVVEQLLAGLGHQLTPVADAQLCCGSAGTYSLLQPELSGRLLRNKLHNLLHPQPELIATANIGCLTHLQSASNVPVVHWIELLAAD